MLRAEVLADPTHVHAHEPAWDALAVQTGRPFCCPAWMMAWWRHVAPAGAQLRVIAVFDGQELVGLAPFFADRGWGGVVRYRLLSSGTSARLDVLARPGREPDVGEAIARCLTEAEPRPDVVTFEGTPAASPWPALLCRAWTGAGRWTAHRQFAQPAPYVDLQGSMSYTEWLASKSANFRQSTRRRQRQLHARGAVVRLCEDTAALAPGLDAFARLHRLRWSTRGGSAVLDAGVERMLAEAGPRLLADRRLRLWSVELGGQAISAHLFLSAGGETSYWLGGFDTAWESVQPSLSTLRAALEHAFASGDRRFDLGPGGQPYKYRFASAAEPIDWTLVVRSGVRAPLARAQLIKLRTRIGLAQRLSPGAKQAARRVLRWWRPVRAEA